LLEVAQCIASVAETRHGLALMSVVTMTDLTVLTDTQFE